MNHLSRTTTLASAIGCALALSGPSSAAGSAERADRVAQTNTAVASTMTAAPAMRRDRDYRGAFYAQREQLQQALKPGMDAAAYRRTIYELGFVVTAVNDRERDYLEYEVVKGPHTHEVQIELENGRGVDVEVERNLWHAGSTDAVLKGRRAEPLMTADFSDRRRIDAWNKEREQLEAAMPEGYTRPFYDAKLRALGYQITARNTELGSGVEYEIVKGDNTYEIEIDIDSVTGRATEVDVRSNLWMADATERALNQRG